MKIFGGGGGKFDIFQKIVLSTGTRRGLFFECRRKIFA